MSTGQFRRGLSRRHFLGRVLQTGLGAGSALWLAACGEKGTGGTPTSGAAETPYAPATATPAVGPAVTPTVAQSTPTAVVSVTNPDLVVAKGGDPKKITEAAIQALGGMGRFVKPGDVVVVKPNICTSRPPEYAATTNPDVMEAVVRLCLAAGAKTVKVFDNPISPSNTAYAESGIEAAVKRAGGQMDRMTNLKYKNVSIPKGKHLKTVGLYDEILNANVVIDVPIAKDHGLSRLTIGMKNLMGVIRDRAAIHDTLGQDLADLLTLIKPQLTVVDAVRILTANGPTGGSLKDVRQTNTVIVSADIVAADSYAATLFNLKGEDLDYLVRANEMGLGEINYQKLNVRQVEA